MLICTVLVDTVLVSTILRFMKTATTKTDRKIAALTKQLTAMRKVGLSYDLPEVQAVVADINALCGEG